MRTATDHLRENVIADPVADQASSAVAHNKAFQPTPLALRARGSLAALGAAERRRWASFMRSNLLLAIAAGTALSGCAAPSPKVTDAVIQTEKGPVEAHKGKLDKSFHVSDRELTTEESADLATKASTLQLLLRRYPSANPDPVTPELLDQVFSAWTNDSSADRPQPLTVVEALGATLGNLLVQNGGYQWRVVTDAYGTTLAVMKPSSKLTAYPMDSIAKRVARKETNFIARLYYAAKDMNPGKTQ